MIFPEFVDGLSGFQLHLDRAGAANRTVSGEFVVLCRHLELFSEARVAIDGSQFKAVNTPDRNFTQANCSGQAIASE